MTYAGRSRAAMIFAILFVARLAASQVPEPGQSALPRLTLDNLPARVKAGLQRAYQEARAQPDDASVVGHLAMMLHAHEQYGSAEEVYRIAGALDPRSLPWAYLTGVVQAELGDDARAVQSFRRSLMIDPHYLSARVELAAILMRVGDLDASLSQYTALARDCPELPIAHYGLGRVSVMMGDKATAGAHYRRAVDLAPQFGAAHYALALTYRDAGLEDLAESHLAAYRRLGARRPVPPDPLRDRVMSLKSTARDFIIEAARLGASGRVEESIALHVKAIDADPTAAQAHVNLISLYGRLGRFDKAEEHYREAVRLESSLADGHYNYGVLLASILRVTDAANAFRHALEVNPFHAQAHNNLGTLLAAEGRLDQAATHYRQAVVNDPGHRAARLNLGRTLVALGRPREAIEHLQRLLVPKDADTPRITYALATAWLAANDPSKADEYAQQAARSARALGETELADKIERALVRIRAVPR